MRKKALLFLIVFIGLIISATGVFADNISVGDTLYFSRGPGSGPGGEFILYDTTSGATFNTFCVETDEYIAFGTQFKVGQINYQAIAGGSNTNSGDPLDPRTAYLYYHFRMGDLSGYTYGSSTSADALQAAIWFIEEETRGSNNSFVALAAAEIAAGNWSGIGNVRIINLVDSAGNYKQDQLTLVPEPSTLLLVGGGLLALGLVARRRKQ